MVFTQCFSGLGQKQNSCCLITAQNPQTEFIKACKLAGRMSELYQLVGPRLIYPPSIIFGPLNDDMYRVDRSSRGGRSMLQIKT
ncbi:hypothetical protein C5I_0130190 [Pseudomonas syringae pv. syringae FF5]|nr:hypothetical protein C5I_0130190 [Pseudomonas syringae pv. syringae FF5]